MDLVAGVRKEGSRGGRDAFKWEDVKDSQHRENYLGHSLMAQLTLLHPAVGRWQKNKDLSWYAKGDNSKEAIDAATARAKEIQRIREAEQDALSQALGYPVEPRLHNSQVAQPKEVEKAIREAAEGDEEGGEGGKGVGFGGFTGANNKLGDTQETMMGYAGDKGGLTGGNIKRARKERRDGRRYRSVSRDRKEARSRRKRYIWSFLDDESSLSDYDEKFFCPPILLVSRQTYTEATPLFYGGNNFRFSLCFSLNNDDFSSKRPNLRHMQGVDLEIKRLTDAQGDELYELAAGMIKEANA
ncbi:MAG: hypothetical protein Q9167_007077 [Letrouitia subvulpina]